MLINENLITNRLELRILTQENASDSYLAWMRDDEVIKYLESRFSIPKDKEDLKSFIESANNSHNYLLLGIFIRGTNAHIGNVKLGPIIYSHARSEIGYLIGQKNFWGKGYASEAIIEVCRFGFENLGLQKITAGVYDKNIASARMLIKSGFVHEATIPSHVIFEGARISSYLFGIEAPDKIKKFYKDKF